MAANRKAPDSVGDKSWEGGISGGSGISCLWDWTSECHDQECQEVVVMRRLNLSERRDSFKKQEAVQEVSFDEPEVPNGESRPFARQPGLHAAPWVAEGPCQPPKPPPVPHIAMQAEDHRAVAAVAWECQALYLLRLEAQVYIEQEDGTTAVEHTSISSQRQGSWEQRDPTAESPNSHGEGEEMDSEEGQFGGHLGNPPGGIRGEGSFSLELGDGEDDPGQSEEE